MLTIADISKRYGHKELLKSASLQINDRDRVGLVGPNGAGKSTLFNMILKEESPDSGDIAVQKGMRVGFLPQESAPVGEETVLELATSISPEFVEIKKQIEAMEAGHEHEDWEDDLHGRFEELGGYEIEPKAKRILAGLAFREKDFERPAKELSGGWVMRAHLARLLVMEPDLLMLDEPTNHLDLHSLLWFQEYLKGYSGAILLISHDREFLNQLVTSIVEIRQCQLIRYRGNYEKYLEERKAREDQHLAAYRNQQKEIDRMMSFVDRFRAKNTKASQAQSKLKQIEKMEKIEAPIIENQRISFSFPQPGRSGLRVIRLSKIEQAYGSNVVYSGLDFEIERGQKIVLVGPNGAGKSTLLKILAGVLEFQKGEREPGYNVEVGYFSQYRVDMLDEKRSVLDEALDTRMQVTEESVRTLLGCFLFSGDDVFKAVGVLSGGEKTRLALVKMLLNPPNLLLMDEPTTHLDMASIDALTVALNQYQGTLVFISHDVYFIRSVAKEVVHVNDGVLTSYKGDYDYYLYKSDAESARSGLTAGAEEPKAKAVKKSREELKRQKREEAEKRQALSKRRKKHQEAVDRLEKEIEGLEAKLKELTEELEKPDTYEQAGKAMELNRDLMAVTDDLEEKQAAWEKAAMELEAIQ